MFINCTYNLTNTSYPLCKTDTSANEDILFDIFEMLLITLIVVSPIMMCICCIRCYEIHTMRAHVVMGGSNDLNNNYIRQTLIPNDSGVSHRVSVN